MEKTCRCGRKFTPKPGPGRPRVRCEQCRPPEKRRDRQPPMSEPVDLPGAEPLGLVESVGRKLRETGRDRTPEGVLALQLARTLAAGGHTASGSAALARELRATLDAATAGARQAADTVDELLKRREQRRRGA